MQLPVQIVLESVLQPALARVEILKAADTLERFHGRITSCRVAVSNPEARHRQGGILDVHVRLRVPGHSDIEVTKRVDGRPAGEHLAVALRNAFAQARRQLQDVAREKRGDVMVRIAGADATGGRFAQRVIDQGFAILRDESAIPEAKSARSHTFILGHVEARKTALFTLGIHWRSVSDAVLESYVEAFREYSTAIYETRLDRAQ